MTTFNPTPHGESDLTLSPPRRRRWVSLLLAIVLLLCGGVIGSGLTLLHVVRRAQYAIQHPQEFPAHAAGRLRSKLHLSDEQTRQVENILRARQANIQKIHRQFQPEFTRELDGLEQDIAAVLDAKQAAEWRSWIAEKRRTWLPSLPPGPSATSEP